MQCPERLCLNIVGKGIKVNAEYKGEEIMPGLDRQGPLGAGPRTGWGLGKCGANAAERVGASGGFVRGVGRCGLSWVGGRGRRFGGQGRGMFAWPLAAGATLSEEATILKERVVAAEAEIAELKARLEELENKG